mgnify:CR=1 FL=1|tara:strand:+ start:6871 stop:7713 length:843 start_codon:yes stop_codon:yes gene_type:complete
MKVLVTGRNGFLAKEIKDHLLDYDLTFLGRSDLDLANTKLVDSFFSDKYFDAVLHTAIVGGRRNQNDTFEEFTVNINMFRNLLRNKDRFGKLINFCSGASFGRSTDIFKFHESRIYSWIPAGADYYGLAKNLIARECNKTPDFFNLRIFGCFGFHEEDTRFIKSAIKKSINNDPIVLHRNREMDFISSKDICTVIRSYLENNYSNEFEDVNLCYSKKETLYSIASKIIALTESNSDIIIETQSTAPSYTGDSSKLSKLEIELEGMEKGLYALRDRLYERA